MMSQLWDTRILGSYMLAVDLGFTGPNYSNSTAHATLNYCCSATTNHIQRGEADMMIASGIEGAIIHIGLGSFVACKHY